MYGAYRGCNGGKIPHFTPSFGGKSGAKLAPCATKIGGGRGGITPIIHPLCSIHTPAAESVVLNAPARRVERDKPAVRTATPLAYSRSRRIAVPACRTPRRCPVRAPSGRPTRPVGARYARRRRADFACFARPLSVGYRRRYAECRRALDAPADLLDYNLLILNRLTFRLS